VTAAPTPTTTSPAPGDPAGGHPRARRDRAGLVVIAAIGVGLGLLWLVVNFFRFREGSYVEGVWTYAFDDAWAFDLEAYVNAALRLVNEGSLYARELIAGPFEPGAADLFYYAPPLGVAMMPFTDMAIADSSAIWWVVRVAALLLACGLMPVKPIIRVFAFMVVVFSLPGLKDPILGNVSLLLLLPVVAAWRWMDRPIGSVALAASISVRPSLGILLVWQLLRRRWRAALWTIVAGLALIVITLPFVGIDGYRDYLAVMGNLNVPAGLSENRDLGGTAMALGASDEIVNVVRLSSIIGAVGAVLLGLRRDRETSFMITLAASLLMVPLLWDHYLATLVIPAAFLAQRLRPMAILLPLLSWLPFLSAFLVILTLLLLFLSHDVEDAAPEYARTPIGASA
jgi:hypothetical protein